MSKNAFSLIGICSIFLILTACGRWSKISAIETLDNFSSTSISIPLQAAYGIHETGTSFVSNSDISALAKEIQNLSDSKIQYTVDEYSKESLFICVYTQNQLSSMLQIVSRSSEELDSPYSNYPYSYWFTNLEANIDGKVRIPFPFHLINNGMEDLGWINSGVEYCTDFSINDFKSFYENYCKCYGIKTDRVMTTTTDQIAISKEMLHSYQTENIPEAVIIKFSQGKINIATNF